MARYVVVEFVDNDEAQRFVDKVDARGDSYCVDGLLPPTRVVGIFVKPGKTCECTDGYRANYGDKNWNAAEIERGGKFGWWICTRCNRPRKAGHQLKNQVKPSETYEGVSFQGYEFGVTDLCISGFALEQIDRPKKLRRKKRKK